MRNPWIVGIAGSLFLVGFGTSSLAAQSGALVLFGYGGVHSPVVRLSDAGDDFGTAFAGGGGVALQVGRTAALRGSATFVRNDLNLAGGAVTDPGYARTLVALDVQFGIPTSAGFVPYFVVGAGRLSFQPDEEGATSFGKFAGRLGTGFNFLFDASPLVFFVEFTSWFYRFDRLDFDHYQVDLALTTGLAYAFPF